MCSIIIFYLHFCISKYLGFVHLHTFIGNALLGYYFSQDNYGIIFMTMLLLMNCYYNYEQLRTINVEYIVELLSKFSYLTF